MKNKLTDAQRQEIISYYKSGMGSNSIAKFYNVHPNSILKLLNKHNFIKKAIKQEDPIIPPKTKISMDQNNPSKFEAMFYANNQILSADYISSLNKNERMDLIDPIFDFVKSHGWQYPDNVNDLMPEFQRLLDYSPNISIPEVNNNDSIATNICKFFCKKFFSATEQNKPTMIDIFNDDQKLKKLIYNRLGLDWFDNPKNNETFNLSFRMLVQGLRSSRLVPSISIFKPSIAKYLYLKYSKDSDTIFDYSAGWGGRLLGAMSLNRNYIGVDPWTTDNLQDMINYFSFKNAKLINSGSEFVKLDENSIDFSFSSPPYFNQEFYSNDKSQAYNNVEDYFYNVYWRKTLENSKYMLKPNKFFALNVKNYPKTVDIAKEYFGPIIEEISMKTLRSHLTKKKAGLVKYEMVYVFKNNK